MLPLSFEAAARKRPIADAGIAMGPISGERGPHALGELLPLLFRPPVR